MQMFERASRKLGLDHVVLDGGEVAQHASMKADEIEFMLRNGAYSVFAEDDTELDRFCAADIDQILERRARVYHVDVVAGGGSVFAKASFKADETDTLDLYSADFWQQVLPQARSTDNLQTGLLVRRCKVPRPSEKKLVPRRLIKEIADRGFRGEPGQDMVLRIAITLFHPDDQNDLNLVYDFLRGPDDEPIEIDDPMKVYGDVTLTIEPHAERIVNRVIFFARLDRALVFAQRPDIEWPCVAPVWEEPAAEYSLMVGVQRYGWGDFEQAIDDASLGLKHAPPLTKPAIEKRLICLIEGLEKQFPEEVVVPPGFYPMSPADWRLSHPDVEHLAKQCSLMTSTDSEATTEGRTFRLILESKSGQCMRTDMPRLTKTVRESARDR
jgi:chromodomain-helicase-DNA-binding protein 7